MNHKQQALRARFSPRSESFLWLRDIEKKHLHIGEQVAPTFKNPTNLGLCALEIPDPPSGYQFCDTLEEADKVYRTDIKDLNKLSLGWYGKGWLEDDDLVFGYAKKVETREEYLRRTMPEGYEWLGRGTSSKDEAPHFTGRAISAHHHGRTWEDNEDLLYRGNYFDLYYIRKIEQPKPEFDPQVGSKWKMGPSGITYTLEQLQIGKFILLSNGGCCFSNPAHCALDAFGGEEAKFTEV